MISLTPAPTPAELAAVIAVLDAETAPPATPTAPAISRWRAAARRFEAERP